MEALEKQNFPFIYIAPFSQIATRQKFLLLQNATSEKCGFEHTLEKKGLELQESSWVDPKLPTLFLQITVHHQSLSIASILFSIQVFKKHKHFTRW